jgi:hypothetical protein
MTVAALGPLQVSALKSGATDLIATRGEAPTHVPVTPNVIGVDELLAKKSAVDQSGNLRNALDLPTFHQSLSL